MFIACLKSDNEIDLELPKSGYGRDIYSSLSSIIDCLGMYCWEMRSTCNIRSLENAEQFIIV